MDEHGRRECLVDMRGHGLSAAHEGYDGYHLFAAYSMAVGLMALSMRALFMLKKTWWQDTRKRAMCNSY